MSPQLVAARAVAKHESEQLGRSATDCAPTSDVASKVCSRKKHFIVEERMTMVGMASVNCLYKTN